MAPRAYRPDRTYVPRIPPVTSASPGQPVSPHRLSRVSAGPCRGQPGRRCVQYMAPRAVSTARQGATYPPGPGSASHRQGRATWLHSSSFWATMDSDAGR